MFGDLNSTRRHPLVIFLAALCTLMTLGPVAQAQVSDCTGQYDGTPCTSDENECTLDECWDQVCANIPLPGSPCIDDGDLCKADICDESGVCQHPDISDPFAIQVFGGGDVKVKNCTDDTHMRMFARVAVAQPGDTSLCTDCQHYEEFLDPNLPKGQQHTYTMPNISGLPVPRLVTAWVRARRHYSNPVDPGKAIGDPVVDWVTNSTEPVFTEEETASLQKRLTHELRSMSLGNPGNDDCPGRENSTSQLRNSSSSSWYRVVASGKYRCARYIDGRDTVYESTEDFFNRLELGPGQCTETNAKESDKGVENNERFPSCCDCPNSCTGGWCDNPADQCNQCQEGQGHGRSVLHCAGFVVTEAKGTDGQWRILSPPVWSDFSADVSLKAVDDYIIASEIGLGCEDFHSTLNVEPIAAGTCQDCTAENRDFCDDDKDGIFDGCDRLVISSDSVTGGRRATLRSRIRNEMYTGERASESSLDVNFPSDATIQIGGDSGQNTAIDDGMFDFDLPNQEAAGSSPPNEGDLTIVVKHSDETEYPAAHSFSSLRSALIATSEYGESGQIIPFDSTSGDLLATVGVTDAALPDEPLEKKLTPFDGSLASDSVWGLDIGAALQVSVVSELTGVEVLDIEAGARLGNRLTFPTAVRGRGVAVEDDVENAPPHALRRYAYVATWVNGENGAIRIVDLEHEDAGEPDPVFVGGESSAYGTIEGEPRDIEIFPQVTGGDIVAYVSSIKLGSETCPGAPPLGGMSMSGLCDFNPLDPLGGDGDCDDDGGGGGGGPLYRRVLLTRIVLDRPNQFAAVTSHPPIELSCALTEGAPPVDELGLALSNYEPTDRRLYVATPDAGGVQVFAVQGDGTLVGPQQAFSTSSPPRDIAVARLQGLERVITTTRGISGVTLPRVESFTYLSGSYIGLPPVELFQGSTPVSVSAHPDSVAASLAVVADEARKEIHIVNITTGARHISYKTVAYPRRVAIQGQ